MRMSRTVTLNNGVRMPLIGLGTFRIREEKKVDEVIRVALECGYRSFDSAAVYDNEGFIGKALKEHLPRYGLTREDIFITTKLSPEDHGTTRCRDAFNRSLRNLGCDYVDLYLIHWPGVQGRRHDDVSVPQLRRESYLQMEEFFKEGKAKAIGISNYTVSHLVELLGFCTVKPTVLQVEYHPHLVQSDLSEFCRHHDIHLQAYSSLGTSSNNQLLTDLVVCQIADKLGRSSAQILLKWAIQQGLGVIPKSVHSEYIRSNIDIWTFTLSEDDLNRMNSQELIQVDDVILLDAATRSNQFFIGKFVTSQY